MTYIPSCHTVYHTKYDQKCDTDYVKKCTTDYRTEYVTVHEKKCKVHHEEVCEEGYGGGYGDYQHHHAPRCHKYPREQCYEVPVQVPEKVPYQACHEVPQTHCHKVPIQVPEEVCTKHPKKECHEEPYQVPRKVPRKGRMQSLLSIQKRIFRYSSTRLTVTVR